MSENTERVRDALAAMERGDLDTIMGQAHPDVEFVNPPTALEPGTRQGTDGVRAAFAAMHEVFENLRFADVEIVDAGDRIVATGTFSGRGRGSKLGFDPQPFAFLVTLKDGVMLRFEWFAEVTEALRAAGVADRDG